MDVGVVNGFDIGIEEGKSSWF